MPTPSDSTDELLLPSQIEQSLHPTCPPEIDRPAEWRAQVLDRLSRAGSRTDNVTGMAPVTALDEASLQYERPNTDGNHSSTITLGAEEADTKSFNQVAAMNSSQAASMDVDKASPAMCSESPPGAQTEEKQVEDKEEELLPMDDDTSIYDLRLSNRLDLHSSRLIQTYTSSMLRPGSKFVGTQQSDAQQYSVEVDIMTVDMSQSHICGYLKIEGLTPEHPTLTTCFEGEIIGQKYTFQTRHADWGATDKDDGKAWTRFPAFRAMHKSAKKSLDFHYKNGTNREHMFMRWKEKFLVPDHRVREINGASFEGFYYICFNQIQGTITGIYYHSKTDNSNNKIQQLELKWVPDRGALPGTEFR